MTYTLFVKPVNHISKKFLEEVFPSLVKLMIFIFHEDIKQNKDRILVMLNTMISMQQHVQSKHLMKKILMDK